MLAFVIGARPKLQTSAAWTKTYVAGSITALYFNVFVLVVQLYQKIEFLKALAPTQSETPFVVTQSAVLLLFVALGIRATTQFRAPSLA